MGDGNSVDRLRAYFRANPSFKEAFDASFWIAYNMGIPEFEQFRIDSPDAYIDWYDWLLEQWIPMENVDGTLIYYTLCLFYFVLDLQPVKAFQTPILPTSVAPWSWLSTWLVDYANELGQHLDKPGSITAETLATFYKAQAYHMWDYPVPPGGWTSFNDFFARHIDPEVRPIDQPNNPAVIVSPADSHFDGSWDVNDDAEVVIKNLPWTISELLQDSGYADRFKGGKFMHSFLNTTDYHRQHAPVAGKVLEAKVIPGVCYLEVVATTDTNGKFKLNMKRQLDAPDDPGYQFMQARALILIDNPDIGLVAVLPIGMAQVSSVVINDKIIPNETVLNKGDEISHFRFGGSDIVLVFEAASKVEFTAKNVHYNFGNQIAIAQRVKK
jgi:phosphatidylserine decarboxylase